MHDGVMPLLTAHAWSSAPSRSTRLPAVTTDDRTTGAAAKTPGTAATRDAMSAGKGAPPGPLTWRSTAPATVIRRSTPEVSEPTNPNMATTRALPAAIPTSESAVRPW